MKTHPMHALLAGLLPALTVCALQAQPATLAAPADRITDAAIDADLQTYEAVQARLKAINAGGRLLRDYHLAKAQCWLDASFHEYTRNDRGPFPQEALSQAQLLALGMEQGMAAGQPPLTMDTPLVAGAVRLRPDLWARAEALKTHRGWRCAQHNTACGEVELVHAGHEHQQLQWRHAQPYVQIAEDLIGEGDVLAERCDPPSPPPPPVAAVAPLPAALPPPPPPPQPVALTAVVMFDFDRSDAAGMRSESRRDLEGLVARIKAERLTLRQLRLIGHADRLNDTGVSDYNQRLSERRAATVQAVLAEMGLPTAGVDVEAAGAAQPVQPCSGRFASPAELQACLLPNRRVEVRAIAEVPGR